MMARDDINEVHWLYFADKHAVLVNSNGGFYQQGKSCGMEMYLVLKLDNAANHRGKDNTMLEEWLWTEHMVLVLFCPRARRSGIR